MDNLEEMDRFLEKFNLLRLNQEETEIMNKQSTNIEIETGIKNLPQNKSPGPDGITEFYQTFREELMLTFLKFFQKIAEEGTLPNSFYDVNKQLTKKISQKNKSQGPHGFKGEFYHKLRVELMPILLKLFQKIAEEGTLPN